MENIHARVSFKLKGQKHSHESSEYKSLEEFFQSLEGTQEKEFNYHNIITVGTSFSHNGENYKVVDVKLIFNPNDIITENDKGPSLDVKIIVEKA